MEEETNLQVMIVKDDKRGGQIKGMMESIAEASGGTVTTYRAAGEMVLVIYHREPDDGVIVEALERLVNVVESIDSDASVH